MGLGLEKINLKPAHFPHIHLGGESDVGCRASSAAFPDWRGRAVSEGVFSLCWGGGPPILAELPAGESRGDGRRVRREDESLAQLSQFAAKMIVSP